MAPQILLGALNSNEVGLVLYTNSGADAQPELGTREDIQEILRTAVELLMEDRRNQAPGQSMERPVPTLPQLLQTLQGMPGAPRPALAQAKVGQTTVGMPMVLMQPQQRPTAQAGGRVNAARALVPNLSNLVFGSAAQAPPPKFGAISAPESSSASSS